MKKKVWSLYRVSTKRQGGEGEEDIPLQKEACHNFAKDKGWKITNEIYEKLSGFKNAIEDREAITEILNAAKNKEFDILLVYFSDRIGRQTEYSAFISLLYEHGIQVWSTKEGELRSVAHEDGLINYIRFWTSEGESKKTSIRVKDGVRQLNETGGYVGGNSPYGYKVVDTGKKRNSKNPRTIKKQVIEESEKEIIVKIFDLVKTKFYGASRIAKHLNDMDITNRGNVWRHNTISRMLRNPIYMGYKRYNTSKNASGKTNKKIAIPREEWKLQPYNPDLEIVSQDTFNEVQSIIDKRSPRNKKSRVPSASQVLLSGMLTCGYCNNRLLTDYSINSHKRIDGTIVRRKVFRYRCGYSKNLSVKNGGHEQSQFGAKTLDKRVEEEVIRMIKRIDLDSVDTQKDLLEVKELNVKQSALKKLEDELAEVEIADQNTAKLFDDVMTGKSTMSLEFVQERLESYKLKREQLQENIKVLKDEISNVELDANSLSSLKQELSSWTEDYKNASSLESKKGMLGKVLDEVIVKKDGVVIIFNMTIQNILSLQHNN